VSFKVHPAIGVARAGNSEEWFVGPTTADAPSVPPGGYKDAAGRVKRQGTSFRVWEYGAGDPVEVSLPTLITWRVQVSSGEVTLTGPNRSADLPDITLPGGATVRAGEIRTDADGRLIFLSGLVDADFDGRTQAIIGATVGSDTAIAGFVFVAGPDFAPAKEQPCSGYDILVYRYFSESGGTAFAPTLPVSFARDVYPILRARQPTGIIDPIGSHPAPIGPVLSSLSSIWGQDAITPVQRSILEAYNGTEGTHWTNDWLTLGSVPRPETPAELDRGSLSHTIGTPLSSGWDFSTAIRDAVYSEPFRFATPPLASPLAVAWQSELPICDWNAGTAGQTPLGGDWQALGFQILQMGTLVLAEKSPQLLLLTPTVDFGTVPREPPDALGVEAPGTEFAPVVFEATPGTGPVTLVFEGSFPAHFTLESDHPPLPADSATRYSTLRLWIRFDTPDASAGDGPFGGLLLVRHVETGIGYPILLTARATAATKTKVVLALDHSFSMHEDSGGRTKLQRLAEAVGVLVNTGRDNDGMGLVPYNQDAPDSGSTGAFEVAELGPIGAPGGVREQINAFATGLTPSGSTSIGKALQSAHTLLDHATGYTGRAIVVVTDGIETAAPFIDDVWDLIDERTFALGIGTENNVDASTLQNLTGNRNGALLLSGSIASGDNEFLVQKYLLQILAQVRRDQIIIDPVYSLFPGQLVQVPFLVTDEDRALDVVVLCPETERLTFALKSPSGKIIDQASVPTAFVRSSSVAFYRIRLPLLIDGESLQRGTWHALLGARDGLSGDIDLSAGRSFAVRGKPIRARLMVYARSKLELEVRASTDNRAVGSMILFEATLIRNRRPFDGEADLIAELTLPSGKALSIAFTPEQPGRYTATFAATAPGLYRARVRARGTTPSGPHFQREIEANVVVHPITQQSPRPRDPGRECESRGGLIECLDRFLRGHHAFARAYAWCTHQRAHVRTCK